MSHSTVYVLVPPSKLRGIEADDDTRVLHDMLAPFNESARVPEYERACHCIGDIARAAAVKIANEANGTIDDLRASFAASQPHVDWRRLSDEEARAHSDARDVAWRAHIAAYNATEEAAVAAHPLKDAADPDCEDCHGTGKAKTTYNPKSRWDWWTVGGRWSGQLHADGPFDVTTDPNNYKPCWVCDATGRRDDELGRAARVNDPTYTCNGCRGTGKMLKFPSELEVPAGANQMPAGEIAARIRAGNKKIVPFAILTPDGEWVERGKMGWWGMVKDEAEEDAWITSGLAVFDKFPDHIAVIVDVHI